MRKPARLVLWAAFLAGSAVLTGPVYAAELDCSMHFTMKGWSLVYKTAQGSGTITCDNGQQMNVLLELQGGGLTVGKSKITDGHGKFTGVSNIKDVLGNYAAASAEASAVKGGEGSVVSNGPVNLAIGGTGDGWDVGVAFSRFSIKPEK